MKVIALYLPQYHDIPENDQWWGKGFTEWVNVKKATPLYEGHYQPHIPLNSNYYNLIDDDVKIWQANLAKKYGVYGFCYYHYWFNGKMLLEQPMEQMLKNKKVDLPFCVCWANEPWTRAWVGETETLIAQQYGREKEWKEHFDYLLPFFKDNRYIKEDNKPLFVIYRPEVIGVLKEMLDYWNELAINNGFDGMKYAFQTLSMDVAKNPNKAMFDYDIEFQPTYAYQDLYADKYVTLRKIKGKVSRFCEKNFGVNPLRFFNKKLKISATGVGTLSKVDYDEAWKAILDKKVEDDTRIPGAFVEWDNTSRHGDRGRVYDGATPRKFQKYMSALIKKAKNEYHKDYIFINAWNEWAEGAHLEPDEKNKYGYLEALKNALTENGEFPSR